jgi:DNA-binding response OmpR family regulator
MATPRRSSAKWKAVSGKKRVLVVEDDPTLLQTVSKHLTKRGLEVQATKDSETALRAIGDRVPDLVCVDLHLPRESGYEVCETIRNVLKLKDLPILLMGDSNSPEARAFAEEAGADRYLTKPFSLSQLDAMIDPLLRTEARKATR